MDTLMANTFNNELMTADSHHLRKQYNGKRATTAPYLVQRGSSTARTQDGGGGQYFDPHAQVENRLRRCRLACKFVPRYCVQVNTSILARLGPGGNRHRTWQTTKIPQQIGFPENVADGFQMKLLLVSLLVG